MEDRFRSGVIGASKICYAHLYPNRWTFSIKIRDSGNWWYIDMQKTAPHQNCDIIKYHKLSQTTDL